MVLYRHRALWVYHTAGIDNQLQSIYALPSAIPYGMLCDDEA
jgi:hypothetical protein